MVSSLSLGFVFDVECVKVLGFKPEEPDQAFYIVENIIGKDRFLPSLNTPLDRLECSPFVRKGIKYYLLAVPKDIPGCNLSGDQQDLSDELSGTTTEEAFGDGQIIQTQKNYIISKELYQLKNLDLMKTILVKPEDPEFIDRALFTKTLLGVMRESYENPDMFGIFTRAVHFVNALELSDLVSFYDTTDGSPYETVQTLIGTEKVVVKSGIELWKELLDKWMNGLTITDEILSYVNTSQTFVNAEEATRASKLEKNHLGNRILGDLVNPSLYCREKADELPGILKNFKEEYYTTNMYPAGLKTPTGSNNYRRM